MLLLIPILLAGCATPEAHDARSAARTANPRDDPLLFARQARALGLKGRLILIMGTSHVAGQAFNLSGLSGFAEIEIDPSAELILPEPTTQPAE